MSETTLSEFLRARGYTGIQMEKNAVGHFEVQAVVNGLPARLLIDTGASRTVIARASVSRFKLAITETDEKAGGVGTSEHAVAYGVAETLELQSFHLSSLPVGVIDLSHVNQALEAHGGTSIDGAIGGDLMGSRAAVIDYQHAILYLRND
jgi:predicted aspartyl protease